MPKIIIGKNVVNFPDSGSDALWSPAVIDFAEIVSTQLLQTSNTYDFAPFVFKITSNTDGALFDIGASFNGSSVRKFALNYGIYRKTDLMSITESGILTGIYNSTDATWTLQDEFYGDKTPLNEPYHSFTINQNKIFLTIKALNGAFVPNTINTINNSISFSAKTELIQVSNT